ncbi:MAG: hypothetical protein KGZ74_12465 [Chitinophagaceae bacterium]|nr:hypothetical protein [Chitinophagaceae bacterium]
MNLRKILFVLIAIATTLLSSLIEGMRWEELAAIGMFTFFLIDFIDSIGKSYNIMDIPILLAIFQCLLMPAVVYHVYNDDYLVRALRYDMTVTADVYYGFMFPAILMMIIGMKLPTIFKRSYAQRFKIAVAIVKNYLKGKGNLGVLLIIIGFVTTLMKNFITGQLAYVVYLLSLLLYVGTLYTYFSDHRLRVWYLAGGGFVITAGALAQGMFGELVYVTVLVVLLILLEQKVKTWVKYVVTIFGFIAVIVLQSVKADYRRITWYGIDRGDQSNTEAFFNLVLERLSAPERFYDPELIFPTINRFNQGMLVGKVLDHVPNRAPFAEGETIFLSLAATFVPRVMWPDKPTAGGHYNMERFAGFRIEGVSMNISPMGEAYGNYGVEGGIFFMFVYGLFFAMLIVLLMNYVKKRPTIILWFPILFLNSVQIETDILMVLNSLIKNILFVAFCYWAANKFLRLKL